MSNASQRGGWCAARARVGFAIRAVTRASDRPSIFFLFPHVRTFPILSSHITSSSHVPLPCTHPRTEGPATDRVPRTQTSDITHIKKNTGGRSDIRRDDRCRASVGVPAHRGRRTPFDATGARTDRRGTDGREGDARVRSVGRVRRDDADETDGREGWRRAKGQLFGTRVGTTEGDERARVRGGHGGDETRGQGERGDA